jgi:hypothetical protein
MSPNVIKLRTSPIENLRKRSDVKKTFLITKTTVADNLSADIKTSYGLREDDLIELHMFGSIINISDVIEACKHYINTGEEHFFSNDRGG